VNGDHTSEVHLSSRLISFGGAAACFAGITTLSVVGDLEPLRKAALYLFAAGLPVLATAGLVFEFIGYESMTTAADPVARRFIVIGYGLVIAAVATLLAEVHWTYAAVFLSSLVIGFVAVQSVIRRHSV
jgi:hypothetical protein